MLTLVLFPSLIVWNGRRGVSGPLDDRARALCPRAKSDALRRTSLPAPPLPFRRCAEARSPPQPWFFDGLRVSMVAPRNCTNGVKDALETDTDCGGSCSPCADGSHCLVDADCISDLCLTAADGESPCSASFGEEHECLCLNTPSPTFVPTPAPTFSPPIVIKILSGNASEVDPTRKITLGSEWKSADPRTVFEWDAESDVDTGFELVKGEGHSAERDGGGEERCRGGEACGAPSSPPLLSRPRVPGAPQAKRR